VRRIEMKKDEILAKLAAGEIGIVAADEHGRKP
jgi:hypothetical protein